MTTDIHRFDAAINPYGCSPAVVEALVAFARGKEYRFYGDEDGAALRARLSALYDLPADNFLVYNGCGEGLVWQLVASLLLERGRLICPYPSYERFVEVARRCASEIVEVPLEPGTWSLPVERFIEEGRRTGARVALISSPNNPTGNLLLDRPALTALLDGLPDCLFIVDEAYAEYAGITFAPWVRERPNLVVLKTFSKAYGLAGLRIGYVAAHAGVAEKMARMRVPWCVDSMALAAAETALGDQAYLRDVVSRIAADSAALREGLAALPGFSPYPSAANFFLVRVDGLDPSRLHAHLASHRVRVRTRPDFPGTIRVTSMTPEDNRTLLDVLARA